MKKLISLILAFAMVFSLAMPAMAADDTRTLYVDVVNMLDSSKTVDYIRLFTYGDEGATIIVNGASMTHVSGTVYSYDVPNYSSNVVACVGVMYTDGTCLEYNFGIDSTSDNDFYTPTSDFNGTWGKYVKTQGDVTASYTPVIDISGVTVGERTEFPDAVAVDETNKTYTVTIPADQTSVAFNIIVSGQNLDKIPAGNNNYKVMLCDAACTIAASCYDSNTGTAVMPIWLDPDAIGTYALQYTTDGGTTWTDTGWKVVIQQAEPEPTAVSLKAKLKAIDSAGAEITDTMIASLDGNTVVNTEIKEYNVIFTGDKTMTWDTIPSGYKTPADVSLTVTDDGNGNGVLTSNSSHATVDLVEGVYVITVELAAESTEVSEAKWGASMDSLTGSGTLAEAIAAAEADSTVKYIQLQSDVTAESSFVITSGEFTIDLNGRTVTSDNHTFDVRNSGTKVTFADSGATGAVTSAAAGYAAIYPNDGAEVLITGGSYSGYFALNIDPGTSAAITGGTFTGTGGYAISNNGTLTISGGTIGSGIWANIGVGGTTTITGGAFDGGDADGNLSYYSGTLDLSGYSDVTGLKVSQQTGSDLTVSDTTIKLPDGYTFVDGSNNAVTTLASGTVYTIAAVSGGEDTTPAVITGVSLSGTGVTYDETTKTYTVAHDATNIVLTVTGTNLQNGTEDNLVAFASGVSAHVTSSYFEFSTDGTTATLTVPNGSFVNSSNFEISYTNDGQQSWTSAGIYVTYDAGTPDTYDVNIAVVENGTVSADMQTAAEDDIVTLTVSPAADYQIGSVTVKDAEGNIVEFTETGAVSGTYKFIMPASDVTVEATFTAIEKTSADIAWGSMAFTYTDGENGAEGAWSNDGSEKAGTVTVTNTGTTAITATPSYAATTDEYGIFTGSFDEDSIGIDAGANWTFKLTLDGTPTKAIPAGTKIGTVTITITEKTTTTE